LSILTWPQISSAARVECDQETSVPNLELTEPVFSGRRRVINRIGIFCWLAACAYFWIWWFDPSHVLTVGRYVALTAVLGWALLTPLYFILIFAGARIPIVRSKPQLGLRVAIVVTKTPSEPFSLVQKTLIGALKQTGCAHDTWLADEDPDAETAAWCKTHGIGLISRKGIPDYNRDVWPRQKICKEGNLTYFYDRVGYDRYDFVAQFDADHVPSPTYLQNALAPFSDPSIGYVSAPSICDSNVSNSWAARGRLYVEASMHGALQSGYNANWAPLCIGSHYTIRTAALRAIGGLGPELAEDHSTTLTFNAHGWRGVHAVNAIAHGEGPYTFADLAIQEFQWARSLVTILLRYTLSILPRLSPRLRFQFLFSELWYPMFSSFMGLMFILPVIALLTGRHFVNVTYVDYAIHILPASIVLLVLAYWWRATGLFRPKNAKIISWEGACFIYLRWPWSLLGSMVAIWDWLRGAHANFRITPKGTVTGAPLPLQIIAPYLLLSAGSAAVALLVKSPGTAAGFYIFCIVNALINWFLVLLVIIQHSRENALHVIEFSSAGIARAISVLGVLAIITAASYQNGTRGLTAMNAGVTSFTLTQMTFSPSGAGRGVEVNYFFRPKWHGFSRSQGDVTPTPRGMQ
jgi:cellulose synthase (UDP-forming)